MEDAGWSFETKDGRVHAGGLHDAAVLGQVAVQHGQAAVLAIGVGHVADAALLHIGVGRGEVFLLGERRLRRHATGRRQGALAGGLTGRVAMDVVVGDGLAHGRRVYGRASRWMSPARSNSPRMVKMPPAWCTSSRWYCDEGATLQMLGTLRDRRSMSAMVKFTPASWATARMCNTVLVEPPMAMSSAMAFSKACKVAMLRGSTSRLPCS